MMRRQASMCAALAVLLGAFLAGSASATTRIVGGKAIDIRAAPWTVFIGIGTGPTEDRCTGSIIDASHILTAAHCVYHEGAPAHPAQMVIKAGISNFAAPFKTDLAQDRSVSSFRIHPGFVNNGQDVPDDVAVITLATPLDLGTPTVQAIALPSSGAPLPVGATVTMAGFGRTVATAVATGPLKSMSATVDPAGQCAQDSQVAFFANNNGVFVCAEAPVDSGCEGDSGAGWVTTGADPVVIGVFEDAAPGCAPRSVEISSYVAAPEILRFIRGDVRPPTAPRLSKNTSIQLHWKNPLVVGDMLTCSTDGWTEPVRITYSFLNASTGAVLQTSRQASYQVPAAAVRTTIACEARVAGAGGTTVVRSSATPDIQGSPAFRIERLAPLSARRGRDVTFHVVLKSRPGYSGRFRACAVLPSSVGGRLCRATRGTFKPTGDFQFSLVFRIKQSAPLRTARVAISAAAGSSTANATALLRITA